MSQPVAALLVAFMGGASVDEAIDSAAGLTQSSRAAARLAIEELTRQGLLIDEVDTESTSAIDHLRATRVMREWGRYGWIQAADYHLATFDYPFLPYERDGAVSDAAIMAAYVSSEPDTDRYKDYVDAQSRRAVVAPTLALRSIDMPFDRAWATYTGSEPRIAKHFGQEEISRLCSAAFGQVRARSLGSSADRSALVRKTSPSGGSRHPTEAYVIAIECDGLERGVYHFSVRSNEFEYIAEAPEAAQLERLFDGLYRSRQERAFEPRAILILTSVFHRNMYRYREPRTFRTVFMDVGHLATTVEVIAAGLGLDCYFQHGIADLDVEHLLGIEGLTEGVIYGASIGLAGA